MKTVNFFFAMFVATAMIVFISCEKEEDPVDQQQVTALDDLETDEFFDDVLDEVDDVSFELGTTKSTGSGTGSRTVENVNNQDSTRTITISYTDYVNPRRRVPRVKNGQIIVVVTGYYNNAEYKRVVTFNNYTVSGHKVTGTKEVERTGASSFRIRLIECRVDFTDGTSYTRHGERIRTQTEGTDTPLFIWDDVYQFTGSVSGVNRRGIDYTHEILEPIVKRMTWRYPVQGKLKLQVGQNEIIIDFGDGTLNNEVDITVNGQTRTRVRTRG